MIQCVPMATIDDFRKLEFRIAEIVKVELHPNADRLWLIQIRIGQEERQVVAGIRQFYTPEELVGKKVVVVANLEPATIRGTESKGMLLAASIDDKLVLVSPEKDIPTGAVVK